MIHSYGITQQGPYHVQKNMVCQDFHYRKKVSDDCMIAAVADGLGSETHSDTASEIAATESVEYCFAHLPADWTEENMLQLISDSFRHALQKIGERVEKENGDINQYDTTLCLAVFKGGDVYFGQSGDSGAIVLCRDGHYEGITRQQRDENGCVFPLAFGPEKWEFGTKSDVVSLLLATDGMLEIFFPFLLRPEKVNIYVALAQFFMDPLSLKFDEAGEQTVQENMSAFVRSIPEDQVNDDKTVLVMVNDAVSPARLEDSYYRVPDWATLRKKRQEEFNRLAYPHLYAKEAEEQEEHPDATCTAGEERPAAPSQSGGSGRTEAGAESGESTENGVSTTEERASAAGKMSPADPIDGKEPPAEKSGGILRQLAAAFRTKTKKE